MVYDVSRNYIGDMHWREDEILQDGDEFELDRGILIQVGEAVGSIEQDLTGLFEKRKKAPEVAVNEEVLHQPVAVPMARPTAAQPSQLRPKTLNALLGTPKGRIGGAALPTKSPHELRTESENSSWGQDRPAKRQRIESQQERMAESNKMPPPRAPSNFRVRDDGMNKIVVGAVSDKSSNERLMPPTVQDSRPLPAGHAVSRPPTPPIQRSENQKDKASKRVVELLPERRSSKSTTSDSTAQQKKRKPDQNDQVSRKAQKSAKRPEHEPETGYARTSTVPEPMEIVSEESATSTTERPKHRAKLLMAPRKPRKKLMYRELLPQEFSAIHRSSGNAPVLHRSSHDRSTSKTPDRCNKDPMTEFHEEEQERLKARPNRHQAKETYREDEREQSFGDAPGDLFLSQEDPDNLPADGYRLEENEPKDNAPISSLTDSRRHNSEPAPSSSRGSLPQEALQHMIPRPPSTIHSTAIALAKMDEILFSRAQPKDVDSVEDEDALPEVLLEDLSSPPTPKTPPDVASTRSPVKDRPGSSPAFQTQAQVLPEKPLHPKHPIRTSPISRPNLAPQCNVVQPKEQEVKHQTSKIPVDDSDLPSHPTTLPKTIPSPSSHKEDPTSAPDPQTHLDRCPPARSPTPDPPIAAVLSPTTANGKPAQLAATFSKIVAPKPPTAKRKPDSLPAFTKVVPTKPRSPLKKSVSDTSAMRPPSALPASGAKAGGTLRDNSVGKDDRASLWSKEAWDLFGCGRDGIECTYEEFRQKEGLA